MTKMRRHVRNCVLTAIIYACFVFAHANQNVITTHFCPSILEGIPDQIITTGKTFQYRIPDSAFKMSKDAVIKITPASHNSSLPEWIYYNQASRELLAVPTIHDSYGIYLKATLEDPKSTCGKIFDVFHIAVTSWSLNIKKNMQASTQASNEPDHNRKSKVCYRGVDLIQTTLIFAVNLKELGVVDRLNLIKNLAHFLGIDSSVITISTGNELFSTQDNYKSYSILASGHGNTVSIVPNATELTWQVPCSVFPEVHLFVQVLQHNVEGGRLTSEVGYNVVGWYISAMVNPSKQQLGRKKRFARRFMTPALTPVPDLVPATKVKPTSSTHWWWWPETKSKSSFVEVTSSELPTTTDKMTKPFLPQSETVGHTLLPSSHFSQISPTKSSYFASSPESTRAIKVPSSVFPETTSSYQVESLFFSEFLSAFSSSLMTSQEAVPEMTPSTDYYMKSRTYSTSTHTPTPEASKSYTEIDSMSGSGDSTYTDEDAIPVIETTLLPQTYPPISPYITPSPPIQRPDTDVHSVTDMPYAGSGSGSGNDEEETVSIQPSTQEASDSLFVPTPSLSSVIDSSESNIFYFEETASLSSSKDMSSSIYIPSWDTDLFSSSTSSSWEIWITKDPWASKNSERTRETWHSEVTESSTDILASRKTDHYTDLWYSRKEDSTDVWSSEKPDYSTDIWSSRKEDSTDVWSSRKEDFTDVWSSKEMGPYTDMWYSRKEYFTDVWSSRRQTEPATDVWYSRQSTDIWSSRETGYSTGVWHSHMTESSKELVESKATDYAIGGLWPEETKPTRETWHTSSPALYDDEMTTSKIIGTHSTRYYSVPSKIPTSSSVHYQEESSSMGVPPYSYPSSPSSSSTSTEIQGEISPSTSSYVSTTSRISSVYIEEAVTKDDEMPSKYDFVSSSRMPTESSTSPYRPTILPDDCSTSETCTMGPTLEASSSKSTTEVTIVTQMIPVSVPTRKKQHTTTSQPTTEQKRITKKPRKRPTQPPIIKTTDYMNKAPKVRAPIGSVYAAVGTIFKFQIPKNTFHDHEDGNTRRLTLDVSFHWEPRRPPSNTNNWLEFDEVSQTLTGLPLGEEIKQSPMEVTINALDKGGKLAQDVIMIYINSTVVDLNPTYEFVMKFEVNGKKFLAERKHMRNLMRKLSSFFGDRDSSYITILDARPGSLILTWTNNSIPTDTCDNATIQEQRKKIFDDNDHINPKFRKYMSPRFTVLSAEFNLDGTCLDTGTEPGMPSDTETGDVTEVNPWAEAIIPTVIAVAIAIFIVVVILLVCSRKQRQKKNQKNEQRNSFEDQDPVMFHSERSNLDRGMRAKRAVILPGDVNPKTSGHRNLSPYQASGFGEPDNCSDDEEEDESGRYSCNNGSTNPPPPYRLPPPYYPESGSSYV